MKKPSLFLPIVCAFTALSALAKNNTVECPPFIELSRAASTSTLINVPSGWATSTSQEKLTLSGLRITDVEGKNVEPKTSMSAGMVKNDKTDPSKKQQPRIFERVWALDPQQEYNISCIYHGSPQQIHKKLFASTSQCSNKVTHQPGKPMVYAKLSCS